MKKKIISATLRVLFLLGLFSGLSSCSKSDEDNEYRTIRYEVTGDVSTPVRIHYTPTVENPYDEFDPDDYEEVTMLPWQKEVRHHQLVQGAGCSASVEEGIPGQKLTIQIFRNNESVATHEGTVKADGHMVILLNYYIDGTVGKY